MGNGLPHIGEPSPAVEKAQFLSGCCLWDDKSAPGMTRAGFARRNDRDAIHLRKSIVKMAS